MIDRVLVIGGGIGGLTAALAAAKAGAEVILVEKRPILGGKLASRLGEGEDAAGLSNGVDLPRAREVMEHDNIEVLPLAEVLKLTGEAGHFTATIGQQARYVTDACTQCNRCRLVCPVVLPNNYLAGLTFRKAIYLPLRDGVPDAYVIDIDHCQNDPPNYLPCYRCVEVCEPDCIEFGMEPQQTLDREVGAVVVAVGYDMADPAQLRKYGYGTHPDILTSWELECLLAQSGPTGGYIEKPSNEEYPESLLLHITDTATLSWVYSINQISRLVKQDVSDITVLYDGNGDNQERIAKLKLQAADMGAKFVRGAVHKVQGDQDNSLHIQYTDKDNDHKVTQEFDLMVLASALEPPEGLSELAKRLEIDLREDGFVYAGQGLQGFISTSRPGICVVGCASGLMDVPETFAQGMAVAECSVHVQDQHAAANAIQGAGTQQRDAIVVGDRRLAEAELNERLEKFVWSLIALGQGNASPPADQN